jgi:hypothetical protein
MLNRFREEIFIPFGLGQKQQRLIFRPKYNHRLDEEPVTVTVGDEKILLRAMDRQSLPRKEEIVPLVKKMKTTKDWEQVIPLLIGLRMSRRYLKDARWEWLVRMAGNANAIGIMLECARQAERTGFRLDRHGIVQKLIFALHSKARAADFKGPETARALSLAEQAVSMMEWPEHINTKLSEDPKRKPFVIGALLELSAARAHDEFEGKDIDGKVQSYAERLLATWPLGSFKESSTWYVTDHMLQENIPIWNGIKIALELKDISHNKSLSKSLKARANDLRTLISRQIQVPENVQTRPSTGLREALDLFKAK